MNLAPPWRWLCTVAVAASLLVVACPKRVEAHHADAPLPAPELCETLHGLVAQRRQACCGGTKATDLAPVCSAQLEQAVKRGAIELDEAALRRCRADLKRTLEGCDWVGALPPPLPPSCTGLVSGERTSGARCETSLECQDGLYCQGATAGSPGRCATPVPVGSRCEVPDDPLASLLQARDDPRHASCAGGCIRGRCLARTDEGGACATSATCAIGLTCRDQRCSADAPGARDATCSATRPCAPGLACSAGKCALPAAAGAECRLPFECRSLRCDKAPGEAMGRCSDACAAGTAPALPGAPPPGAKLF
jgi:hypothetical protein